MIVIANMIGLAFVKIIGIGGIIINYCDVCECVCFSLQSARHPIVLLMGAFTLWGDRIPPLASILFPLLESRCFLLVFLRVSTWDFIGVKIIHTYM